MRRKPILIFMILQMLGPLALARVVSSTEEEVRLNGYQDYLRSQKSIEQLRLSDVGEIKTEKQKWEREQERSLEIYRREKSMQQNDVDDSGAAFHDYVEEQLREWQNHRKDRSIFVEKRDETRAMEKHHVNVSEETEYELADNTPRVAWNLRKFGDTDSTGGATLSGGNRRAGNGGRSDFNPTPPPNNNGYYEAPPPPPPMSYEQQQQGWEMPPPPPPQMFEEENPF